MKRFNTTGPCFPDEHYMMPALDRLPGVRELVAGGGYFVVHAPRHELNAPKVPFLVGEIGDLPGGHGKTINPLLSKAVRLIPHSALVPASDLTGHMPDGVHFDAAAQRQFGARYYDAWVKIPSQL